MDLKTKTCLVVCSPLFISLAERLARDFKKTYLHIPVSGSFVTMNAGRVGTGLKGVEKVDSVFGAHFDKVDLFVFPDLGYNDLQVYIETLGKRVWGGRNGEELEVYREVCKKLMEQVGLPVAPWQMIKGIDALREHLKSTPDQHVKVDKWRGLTETFFSPSYDIVMPKLSKLEHDLGGFRDEAEFIVEDDLPDRVEVGLDAYCIDGQYPSKTLIGIEVKDLGYVAEFMEWASIPEPLRRWNEEMAPTFARYGYRGFLSNEIRIGEDQVPYMIDACCRAASPPSELYQEFYSNISEIIWEGADGNLIDPEPVAKFGAQVVLKSSWANGQWQAVEIPPEFEKNVKLFNCVCVEGKRYVLPLDEEMSEIGGVIGWGDTLEAALEMVRKAGEAVQGYGIKFSLGPVETAVEQMQELADLGLPVFSLESQSKAST